MRDNYIQELTYKLLTEDSELKASADRYLENTGETIRSLSRKAVGSYLIQNDQGLREMIAERMADMVLSAIAKSVASDVTGAVDEDDKRGIIGMCALANYGDGSIEKLMAGKRFWMKHLVDSISSK
jgi:hypothetical protein